MFYTHMHTYIYIPKYRNTTCSICVLLLGCIISRLTTGCWIASWWTLPLSQHSLVACGLLSRLRFWASPLRVASLFQSCSNLVRQPCNWDHGCSMSGISRRQSHSKLPLLTFLTFLPRKCNFKQVSNNKILILIILVIYLIMQMLTDKTMGSICHIAQNQAWWHKHEILPLGSWRQKDQEFIVILGFM